MQNGAVWIFWGKSDELLPSWMGGGLPRPFAGAKGHDSSRDHYFFTPPPIILFSVAFCNTRGTLKRAASSTPCSPSSHLTDILAWAPVRNTDIQAASISNGWALNVSSTTAVESRIYFSWVKKPRLSADIVLGVGLAKSFKPCKSFGSNCLLRKIFPITITYLFSEMENEPQTRFPVWYFTVPPSQTSSSTKCLKILKCFPFKIGEWHGLEVLFFNFGLA